MPIYEYRCQECGRLYEEWSPTSAPREGACPQCGDTRRARVPSCFAIASADLPAADTSMGACACGGSCACGSRTHRR